MRLKLPSTEYLRRCLRYNKRTGVLTWRKRPREHFVSNRGWNRWNSRYAGREAFTATSKKGHRSGAIDKRLYQAHRVIWKMVTGKDPVELIDHKDLCGSNNRWRNLREASNGQNRINSHQRKNNPRHGVRFQKGRWVAYNSVNGKHKHIGCFGTEAEAISARRVSDAEQYGEFS